MRTGSANLPLHGGSAPRWLFGRMTKLSREITRCMVEEHGPREMLARLADPWWFQAFGCVLGFDWHSSGVTTTVCGALKQALRGTEADLGLFVAGGKGKTSRRTPDDIAAHGERFSLGRDPEELIYASRMSAKVDNTAVQDGYQLYHHTFLFTRDGHWAVVQQGMNEDTAWARRYHWLSDEMDSFVREPHRGVCSEGSARQVLNMVARESEEARQTTALLSQEKPERLASEIERMQSLSLPRHHEVLVSELRPDSLKRILLKSYERQPQDFQQLLEVRGVGPKAIRALALISDLVYGIPASTRDPAAFSFAHGGKDGYPYPVDRETYDRSIEVLREAVNKAHIGDREKLDALRRLAS
ncbi:MAG: DUF763 domain-containing protein [Armatimonadota bacterium]|nr:MAG: DUF763 domain-containing protein [Armatimonadota bacterium]